MDHLPQALTDDPRLSSRPVDIVISGTTMWNPGDDFVRNGVIAILRKLAHPRPLNLFFYNFSADVLPPYGQLGGRGNNISGGDLELLGDSVDAVVIAGLSAGREIKDLYSWVIDAGLTDRVLMIGAGYENTYVDRHCREDPEATIFANAKIITGRTAKKPDFIASLGTPYVHLPCPSPLSVDAVKQTPMGRRARRLGFSLQLPHAEGIVNQATGPDAAKMAMDTMLALASSGHDVTLIAHHKTEYTAFCSRFKNTSVRVVFQTFAKDLAPIYRDLDVMITTRLHAGLGANAHGLPALVINDTDRHTHALDGFRHCEWANTPEGIEEALGRLLRLDLGEVSRELAEDKAQLMDRYTEALREPVAELIAPEDPRERIARAIMRSAGTRAVKHRVLSVFERLTADHWLGGNKTFVLEAARRNEGWFDTVTILNWWARAMKPRTYVEIGVRRGRSLAQVLNESPGTMAYGFDLWLPGYGSLPGEGIRVENPGPDFVRDEMALVGAGAPAGMIQGDSAETVPAFFDQEGSPQEIDLLLVDGDHTAEGARRDLDIAFERVAPGGAIVFDDITHPSHPALMGVWESYQADRRDWLWLQDNARMGTAIAVRPPFDRLASVLAERWDGAAPAAKVAERDVADLCGRLLRPGMTVLDIGAHDGRMAAGFADAVGPEGRVIAVEPAPASVERLRALAGRYDQIIVEPGAVTDAEGAVEWRENGDGIPSQGTPGDQILEAKPGQPETAIEPVARTTVRALTLPGLLERHGIDHVDLVKIDAEGAVPMVLESMKELLEAGRIGAVVFELSERTLEGMDASARACFDTLRAAGHTCHAIGAGGAIADEVHDSDARRAQYVAISENVHDWARPAPIAGDGPTPMHAFTIVLNGMPYLPHVYESLRGLSGAWHWHVIEGVSDLVHDTAWSLKRGATIPDGLHRACRSVDGTSEFLDTIARDDAEHVTVYRKPAGQMWDGKREMVSAPLRSITDACLLMQIDVDEIWTTGQLEGVRRLFAEHPLARAAFYRCHYFVGPDRVITSLDTYGNHSSYEWIRTWRFTPGCRWEAHEPPRLLLPSGQDLATINPLMHDATVGAGLVFQHFAYATEEQLRFKQDYYGYDDAVEQWRSLQRCEAFPARLGDHFAWVRDGATVELASSAGVRPLIELPAYQERGVGAA